MTNRQIRFPIDLTNNNQQLNLNPRNNDLNSQSDTKIIKANLKNNHKSSSSGINIPEPIQLAPLTPLTFNQQASYPQPFYLSFQHSRQSMKEKQLQIIQQKYENQLNLELNNKKEQIEQLQKELSLLKQLYNEQKQKYLDLKNLYKEGQYLFLVLQDKKNSIQKQNKQLKNLVQELSKCKCPIQHHNNENIQFNNNHSNSHSYSCQSESSHASSKYYRQNYKNQEVNLKYKELNDYKTSTQRQVSLIPIQTLPSNSTKIKIGRKQKEIPVIKVNVPEQTFSINFNQKQQLKNIKKSQENLQTGTSQYLNYNHQVENPSRILNPIAQSSLYQPSQQTYLSYSQSGHKSQFKDFSISQSENNSQQFRLKYQYCQKELLKKDELLKNLYEQCYKLQKQLDDLRLLDGFKLDFQKQKVPNNYEISNNKQKKRIQQLQEKIISLTSYSKKLLSDCDDVIKQLKFQNQLLIQKNVQFQQSIKTQQDQLKRLYKVLQNKNIELGEIYSSLKLAQSRKKLSNYSQNYSKSQDLQKYSIQHQQKFK